MRKNCRDFTKRYKVSFPSVSQNPVFAQRSRACVCSPARAALFASRGSPAVASVSRAPARVASCVSAPALPLAASVGGRGRPAARAAPAPRRARALVPPGVACGRRAALAGPPRARRGRGGQARCGAPGSEWMVTHRQPCNHPTMTIGVVGLRAVGGRGAGLRAAARFGGCAASAARSPPRPASCAACFRPFRARGVKTPALPRARWCVWVGGGALRLWCPRRVRGGGALRWLRPLRFLGRSLSPPGAAAQLRKRRGGVGALWGAAGSAGVTLRRRCRRCSAPLRTTSRRPDG